MRLELSSLLTNVELQPSDTNTHLRIPFFDPALLQRSEFIYRNQLIQLKDTDLAMMDESLKQVEDEAAKKLAGEKASLAATAPA